MIILYCALLVGMAMVMMPVSTTGLNQLPKRLYPHGTAIMNTLQQVSGGIGTAVFVGIMVSGQHSYLSRVPDPEAPQQILNAMISGLQLAFLITMVVALGAFILSLFLKRTSAPKEERTEGVQQ
ncbi:lincomycin resistance protein LmrB [Terrilactibacillus sp. S3-3]|nr:lincomycin resistance protein LmrB [Terrilactibacillus sp. S3-3]